MFEKLFGKKEEKQDKKPPEKPAVAPVPAKKPPEKPPVQPIMPGERREPRPMLRVSEDGVAAEERAKAAIAAINQAGSVHTPPPAPRVELPESAGVREQSAAYFANGEHKRAIDLLVLHLNKTSGDAPKSIWFMLMDAYQALGQQAAFEKSAWMFSEFFKVSPPSWEPVETDASEQKKTMGRNVLVLDGIPSRAHPEKVRDFIAAARQEGQARLDLSRTRLDEDHVQRAEDLQIILDLMRKLRRYAISTLLMGENQLVEVLRAVIQNDLPAPRQDLYWLLLLEFMQWRGSEEAYEDLAISFGKKFGKSAPGYETSGAIALAPTETLGETEAEALDVLQPPPILDEITMRSWLAQLEPLLPSEGEVPLRVEMRHVRLISFAAAGLFASALRAWDRGAPRLVIVYPSELLHALFDVTGIAGLVSIEPRKR